MTTATGVMPEVSGTVFEVGDLAYSIERRDGHVFHRETRRDKSGRAVGTTEAEVRYVLGSGTRGFSFLVERDGGLFQSPIAWYTQQRSWDLAPTYREHNLHFDRPISLECLFCHTNRVEMVDGKPPVFHGLSIGCERCHGPGELHARRPERIDGKDLTIVNPADLEPRELRESVCNQCHLQGVESLQPPGPLALRLPPRPPPGRVRECVHLGVRSGDARPSRRASGADAQESLLSTERRPARVHLLPRPAPTSRARRADRPLSGPLPGMPRRSRLQPAPPRPAHAEPRGRLHGVPHAAQGCDRRRAHGTDRPYHPRRADAAK